MAVFGVTAPHRVEGHLPGFEGATDWVNSPPLAEPDLRGKVVLVDFWTYTCINWLRTLPYVRAWDARYRKHGLVIVGVHTPEFEFEQDIDSVRAVTRQRGITYPVAIDNDYAVWGAFTNRYWPAAYFVDAHGAIRHHHFGEGEYERLERVIQELLAETGARDVALDPVSVDGAGDEAQADWSNLASPETYLGYERADNFASPGGAAPGQRRAYTAPPELRLNGWGLAGSWTIRRGSVELHEPGGSIAFRFRARDLHLVMGPAAQEPPVRFRVTIDGQEPGVSHGADVDEGGEGVASQRRLYQLVRQRDAVGEHTFAVTFRDSGVNAYVFTFG